MAHNETHQDLKEVKQERKGHQSKQFKLGVALSGGGARGFAHAGALMAIEEAGLRPDVVAGVSEWQIYLPVQASSILRS